MCGGSDGASGDGGKQSSPGGNSNAGVSGGKGAKGGGPGGYGTGGVDGKSPGSKGKAGSPASGGFLGNGLLGAAMSAYSADNPLAAATFGLASMAPMSPVGLVGMAANTLGAQPSTPDGQMSADGLGNGLGSERGRGPFATPTPLQVAQAPQSPTAAPLSSAVPGLSYTPAVPLSWSGNQLRIPGAF